MFLDLLRMRAEQQQEANLEKMLHEASLNTF